MQPKLEKEPVTDSIPNAYLKSRIKAMHNLGIGKKHNMHSVFNGNFLPSLMHKGYNLQEKYKMRAGKFNSGISTLWKEMLTPNLITKIPKLEIPVYFFGSIYEYTVSIILQKEYVKKLQATVKVFYTFDHSTHRHIFEEPEKVKEIMLKDLLYGSNAMSD
jgi:pimeloyl-ACP methyl ester carboxylesterase